MTSRRAILRLGSARASRAGDDALVIANFSAVDRRQQIGRPTKPVSARRRNQHARRVRSPIGLVLTAALIGGLILVKEEREER